MWRIQIQNMYLKGENTGLINGKYAKKVKCSYLKGRSTVSRGVKTIHWWMCSTFIHSVFLYSWKMLLNLIRRAKEINVDRAKPQSQIQLTMIKTKTNDMN